jgi:hypothetical protein
MASIVTTPFRNGMHHPGGKPDPAAASSPRRFGRKPAPLARDEDGEAKGEDSKNMVESDDDFSDGDDGDGGNDDNKRPKVERSDEIKENKATISKLVAALAKAQTGNETTEPFGDKVDTFVLRQLPQSLRGAYAELGEKNDWDISDFIDGLTTIDLALGKPDQQDGKEEKSGTAGKGGKLDKGESDGSTKAILIALRKDLRALKANAPGSVNSVKDIFEKHGVELPSQRNFGRKSALVWADSLYKSI